MDVLSAIRARVEIPVIDAAADRYRFLLNLKRTILVHGDALGFRERAFEDAHADLCSVFNHSAVLGLIPAFGQAVINTVLRKAGFTMSLFDYVYRLINVLLQQLGFSIRGIGRLSLGGCFNLSLQGSGG